MTEDLIKRLRELEREVERIKGVNHTACTEITKQITRADVAEQQLAEANRRLAEIAALCSAVDYDEQAHTAIRRIAALATPTKESGHE